MGDFQMRWDPFDLTDPGPCLDVVITNSEDVMKMGREVGLEYTPPLRMKALLDTGASVTVISRTFAQHCKLFHTCAGGEITAVGAPHPCGEHAGAISFPGTTLRAFNSIRLVSVDFLRERSYSCLIGRDILRHWTITFDGRRKLVTITDNQEQTDPPRT
jgi:hypothetical protein